jgi:hypothetical protein
VETLVFESWYEESVGKNPEVYKVDRFPSCSFLHRNNVLAVDPLDEHTKHLWVCIVELRFLRLGLRKSTTEDCLELRGVMAYEVFVYSEWNRRHVFIFDVDRDHGSRITADC